MQTGQTQTTRTQNMQKKSKLSTYFIISSVLIGVIGFVWTTAYFKFYMVEPDAMGSMFYSWREEGANDTMFRERPGKFPKGAQHKENNEYLKEHFSNSYPEHMPRDVEGYMTFAFPGMDLFLEMRKAFISQDLCYSIQKEMQKDKGGPEEKVERQKSTEEKELVERLKTNTLPIYMEELESSKIEEILMSVKNEIGGERWQHFKEISTAALTLFINIANREEGYFFKGRNVPEKAQNDLADLLDMFAAAEDENNTVINNAIKGEDVRRFLKKNVSGEEKITQAVSKRFFKEIQYGTLPPFYSFGYSRLYYLIYFLTLDDDFGHPHTSSSESTSSISSRQDVYEKRVSDLATQMSYVFAKMLSPEIGPDVVKKTRNTIVNYLFTRKISEPPKDIEKRVERLVSNLEEKKKMIEKL